MLDCIGADGVRYSLSFRCTKCNQNLSSYEVINDEPYCRNCFIKVNSEGKTIAKEELH